MEAHERTGTETTPHVGEPNGVKPREVRWRDWWSVGCGVESLHAVLTDSGHEITLDEALAEALALDGYDDGVGWRHRALVAVAHRHGLNGDVVAELTPEAIRRGGVSTRWLVSVRAPEQFESTHLVAVRLLADTATPEASSAAEPPAHEISAPRIEVFWPQGHLEFGERFEVTLDWLARRMTGRGMRFDAAACGTQSPHVHASE